MGTDDATGEPGPFTYTQIGVTGTPVIDMNAKPDPILYVVGAVCFDSSPPCNNSSDAAGYYLFAVDIVTGQLLLNSTPTEINGTVPGSYPGNANKCTSDYYTSGNIAFSPNSNNQPNAHLQRSALLLLNKTVYVAFADLPEYNNGWIFGYTLNGNSQFQMVAIFASTPYGTGGGFWGAGAGPASDGTYIFTATANGTIFDPNSTKPAPVDLGDALLKLQPISTSPGLTVADWWTPNNVLSYQGTNAMGQPCTSLCECDEDLASGGVLVVPPPYKYLCTGSCTQCSASTGGSCSVVINADKQSNIYVTNQNNLGGYKAAGGNNIETVVTPCVYSPGNGGTCAPVPPSQGYWSSPAYWFDGSIYWLYYSATLNVGLGNNGIGGPGIPPAAVNAYQLQTTGTAGPVSQVPFANSGTSNAQTFPILFCDFAPTPSVSSGSTAGSGIVWGIEENQNKDNNPLTKGSNPQDCNGTHFINNPAALHAFCAAAIPGSGTPCPSAMTELYNSRTPLKNAIINSVHGFPTPTIFQGQVYMGTDKEVDVFGICSTLKTGCVK